MIIYHGAVPLSSLLHGRYTVRGVPTGEWHDAWLLDYVNYTLKIRR